MNVKIAEDAVVFKITETELNALSSKGTLDCDIPLGGGLFALSIGAGAEPGVALHGADGVTTLSLTVSAGQLGELRDMGKNRDGLRIDHPDLDIRLQVDMRRDSRPRATP